jgi:histidinol phosphatase-like PHP family hydrolase
MLERMKKMIEMVKKAGKKVVVNSDAHFVHEIGDDSNLKKRAKELGLTEEMIINNYPKELEKFLGLKN